LEIIGVNNWKNTIQNQQKWRHVVMEAKHLADYYKPEEKEETLIIISLIFKFLSPYQSNTYG